VTRAKQLAVMILLGAAMLALAIVVWVLNRDSSSDILAVIALLGGLAVVVIVLPLSNGKNGNGKG
jgi:hypothetical protein